MKKQLLVLACVIFMVNNLLAQLDNYLPDYIVKDEAALNYIDTSNIDPVMFFPVFGGNFWEYKTYYVPNEPYYFIEQIEKDTTLADGTLLAYWYARYFPDRPRYSIDTNFVVIFDPEGSNFTQFKLNTFIGDIWLERDTLWDNHNMYYRYVNEYPGTYFGQPTIYKEFVYFVLIDEEGDIFEDHLATIILAYGFGKVYLQYSGYAPEILIGAVINGVKYGSLTDINNSDFSTLISELKLHQNYPNPFNSFTNISFNLPQAGFINLVIYNLLGEKISEVSKDYFTAGTHTLSVNLAKVNSTLSSGIYIYTLNTSTQITSRKMVYLK
ncbi:MAG: T9SS type A sorting domain-containing protein [Bacteroidetes bacterium]|nr:T9SS type A sorting domain-containing protein [Bacteroidota bacterium]